MQGWIRSTGQIAQAQAQARALASVLGQGIGLCMKQNGYTLLFLVCPCVPVHHFLIYHLQAFHENQIATSCLALLKCLLVQVNQYKFLSILQIRLLVFPIELRFVMQFLKGLALAWPTWEGDNVKRENVIKSEAKKYQIDLPRFLVQAAAEVGEKPNTPFPRYIILTTMTGTCLSVPTYNGLV